LALSDFLLATAVLPLSTANECLGHWVFGRVTCNVWLLVDVLCCTASLWNICIIALDRFTATLYPIWYRERRSSHQALLYVAVVWTLSTAVCVPPLLGWNDLTGNYVRDNITDVYRCILFQSPSYVLYSASGSFFVPFFLTVFLYVQIFIVLRKRMKKMRRATGGGGTKVNSQKSQTAGAGATLTAQSTSRLNETSILLPAADTAADHDVVVGDCDRAITSIEMTELNDGTLLQEDSASLKSVCSVANEQQNVVKKKTVHITETVIERVPVTNLSDARSCLEGGNGSSASGIDCRSCFTRRQVTNDSCSDDTIVSSSNRRPPQTLMEHCLQTCPRILIDNDSEFLAQLIRYWILCRIIL